MRSTHKANRLEQQRDAEALARLQASTQGSRILEACGGDVQQAEPIFDELRRQSGAGAAVIQLPLPAAPILDFHDVLAEPAELHGAGGVGVLTWRSWLVAIALGVVLWLLLAAAAFGVYELVAWLRP
jgi:hypothetical protein